MAKQKEEGWVPQRKIWANCTVCGLGYTAKRLEDAGFHCRCGNAMAWNNLTGSGEASFMSGRGCCDD